MTTPHERARAVLKTRLFLMRLSGEELTPGVPEAVRYEAEALLRHYPSSHDVAVIAELAPGAFEVRDAQSTGQDGAAYWRWMIAKIALASIAFFCVLFGLIYLAIRFGHHSS